MEKNKDMMRYMEMPVLKAIAANALPAIGAMIMVLLYNLADTFFIGRTHDPYQVAAISLCSPIFLICVAFGSIYGIGGTSLISRTLGEGKNDKAKRICSFCFWGGAASGLFLTILIFLFSKGLLTAMGAAASTFTYARTYLLIIAFCCPFAVISNSFNNILRSEGKSKEAMGGQFLGNLINIILDPIFISGLKLGITGAAIATVIGSVIGTLYYVRFFISGKSSLSIRLKDFTVKDKIASGVFAIGIPAALGTLLNSTSQILANSQMMSYSDLAVAGYGVAGKIIMITGCFCVGLGQGIQPLIGFCVGSRNKKRFKEFVSSSMIVALIVGTAFTVSVMLFRKPIVLAFLQEPQAVKYATTFTTILLSTGFLFGAFYVMASILQAMGKSFASLIVNISRQGLVFIPCLFLMKSLLGINGIAWAQPTADVVAALFAAVICFISVKEFLHKELPEPEVS